MSIRILQTKIYGANCYLVDDGAGGIITIDPGAGADEINGFLRKNGLHLSYILLTHGHVDHVYDTAALRDEWDVPVAMHGADCYLTDGTHTGDGLVKLPAEGVFTPSVLLNEGDAITVGTASFSVLHTPGHSPGSCCFLMNDILFTGDTLFAGSIGRTDLTGGDPAVMNDTLQRFLSLPDELAVLPGHGSGSTIGWEKENNMFLNGDAAKRGWM